MQRGVTFVKHKLASLDRKYLTSGLLSMGTNDAVGVLIALATSYVFANYLDKNVFGNYQFVLTILGVMTIFTLRGVEKQIIRSFVRSGQLTLVPKTIQFFLYTLPVVTVGIAASLYFYTKGNVDLAAALLVVSLFFPLLKSFLLYRGILLAKEKFKKLAALAIIQNALPAAALIAAIFSGSGLIGLILTYCIAHSSTLFLLYSYTLISEKIPLRARAERTTTELHLSFGQSILELGKIADRLIVFSFLGTTAFASYMIGLLPVRELNRLPQMLRTLVLPKFSKYTYEQVRAKAFEKTALLFVLFSAVAGLYILAAPTIFSILFPLYPESVLYTQLIVLVFPFTSYLILVQMLTVFDKTKELYIANTLYSITNVALIALLVLWAGVIGVIIGKIIALTVRLLILIYFCTSDYSDFRPTP